MLFNLNIFIGLSKIKMIGKQLERRLFKQKT